MTQQGADDVRGTAEQRPGGSDRTLSAAGVGAERAGGGIERVRTVVVGGGLAGSASAWELAGRGHEVLLLDQFGPANLLGASHGASRIFRMTYPEPDYLALGREALRLWRELEAESGKNLLTITGGISHGFGERTDAMQGVFEAAGIEHEWLDPSEAARRFPGMAFEGSVLHEISTAGRINADLAIGAFQDVAAARGAQVRHNVRVTRIEVTVDASSGRVTVHTEAGRIVADTAVVAVGAWTTELLTGLIDLPELVVTQEQPAHFALRARSDAAQGPLALSEADWPSFTHDPTPEAGWPSGTYGLATPGEGIKVGFHGVGPRTDPNNRSPTPEPGQLEQLLDYVRHWLPGLDPDALEPVSCTYTTSPDHDFILDRRGPLVIAAGFSGHGFKFGPALGRVLADLVDSDAPDGGASQTVSGGGRFALGRFEWTG